MNQPPPQWRPTAAWRRPRGVAAGTWEYLQQRSIADHYDAFVADTPLCQLDQTFLERWLPGGSGPSPEVVLDLGAGTGRAAFALARRGYEVVAIDLSQPMLRRLIQQSRELGVTAVHPLRANLVELDCLGTASADHAICLFSTLGMIQGRRNRLAMLQHVARAVRPGGQLIVHVHNRWAALREPGGVRGLVRSAVRARRSEFEFGDTEYAYRGLQRMFLHRFTKAELMRDLRRSGWQVDEVISISIDGNRPESSWKIPGGFILRAKKRTDRSGRTDPTSD